MSRQWCTWWEHHDGFDRVEYFVTCNGMPTKLAGGEAEIAQAVWAEGSGYCPFCGSDIDYCQEDEVAARIEDEREYRRGVALGLYGYGGD